MNNNNDGTPSDTEFAATGTSITIDEDPQVQLHVLPKRKTSASTVDTVPYGSLDSSQIPAARTHTGLQPSAFIQSSMISFDPTADQEESSDHHDGAASQSSHYAASASEDGGEIVICNGWIQLPSLRRIALALSLYLNIAITISKLVAYLQTFSLSVLAALLDSVLDVVSQSVLNYTEKHSTMQRSSAFYPAGASRLEPIGVLTCAALMGMASFEVLKESALALADRNHHNLAANVSSVYNMIAIVLVKLGLLWLCNAGANRRRVYNKSNYKRTLSQRQLAIDDDLSESSNATQKEEQQRLLQGGGGGIGGMIGRPLDTIPSDAAAKHAVQLADPTLEALAQDHWNDALSNGVAATALLCAVRAPSLWFLDPIGAIIISLYIIYSWYTTGKEQIEHLTGKSAPEEFIEELRDLANDFDDRAVVDTIRAYHFGPKFLVEIEIVMDASTLLYESHDLGMELQYEIEGREEVERCFVHIDYQTRPYDEHVVSKVPELKEKYLKPATGVKMLRSAQSV